jgi:hypothetical protein
MLTRRLSSHSIQMSEDYSLPMSLSTHERRSAASRRPSAIPRPSLTQERSASGSSQKGGTGGKVPPVKRTRTQSTPYPYDRDSGGAIMPEMPAPSNEVYSVTPSSPRKADDRSSKIPKASGGLRSDSYGGNGSFYFHTRMNSTQRQYADQRMEVDERRNSRCTFLRESKYPNPKRAATVLPFCIQHAFFRLTVRAIPPGWVYAGSRTAAVNRFGGTAVRTLVSRRIHAKWRGRRIARWTNGDAGYCSVWTSPTTESKPHDWCYDYEHCELRLSVRVATSWEFRP